MRRIVFNERNRSGNLLHVETPLGIVNIRVGLRDAEGRRVDAIEVIPNNYAGEPKVERDGYANTRLIEQSDEPAHGYTFAAMRGTRFNPGDGTKGDHP